MRHLLIATSLLVTLTASDAPAQEEPLRREYLRFAELAKMLPAGEYGEMPDYRRSALKRAEELEAIRFTNPALRRAAGGVAGLAPAYDLAQRLRDSSSWTTEEQTRVLSKLLNNRDDKTQMKGLADMMGTTRLKVSAMETSRQMDREITAIHSQHWTDVIPIARQLAGPDLNTLPLRIGGIFWALNTSGRTLNNLTLIIETDASKSLPASFRRYVTYLKKLEANHFLHLPTWLIEKLRNDRAGRYEPGPYSLRCTIYSDEMRCEDIRFTLKTMPRGKHWWNEDGVSFFPEGFKGKGNYTSATSIRNVGPDEMTVGSHWFGVSYQEIPRADSPNVELIVTKREGDRFEADMRYRRGDTMIPVRGTIKDGVVQWTSPSRERHARDGRGIPARGEIIGRSLSARYSGPGLNGRRQEGGIKMVRKLEG